MILGGLHLEGHIFGILRYPIRPLSIPAVFARALGLMGFKKAMSRGFSGGKQVIKSANTRNRAEFVYSGNNHGKLWVEVIIVTFLDAVVTVDVLTPASKNDVKHVETRTVHFSRPKSSFRF